MHNTVYLRSYSGYEHHLDTKQLKLPLESLITHTVYKACLPSKIKLIFVYENNTNDDEQFDLNIGNEELGFMSPEQAPWQVNSCVLPAVIFDDLIITGLCAVARHICVYRSSPCFSSEHEAGLLGFRQSCLQAPNEASIWTKFCEVDMVKTVKNVIKNNKIDTMPINLLRFENHLNKPVKVHNVYKLARDLKKISLNNVKNNTEGTQNQTSGIRTPKHRKWKSNVKKELEINSSMKIEDLDIHHQFAEGPFLTLADLILYPNYCIIMKRLSKDQLKQYLPQTYKWFNTIKSIPEMDKINTILDAIDISPFLIESFEIPVTNNVSLYKCDPKRHNPKKRLYTKENDIEAALNTLTNEMELSIIENKYDFDEINWDQVPEGANPTAGHLPDERKDRKTQQLENLTLAVLNIAKDGDLIVDFCSGSGHLGILIAHLLPNCTIILLENKEQSILRARERVKKMNFKNVNFFQCNLDFFIGNFDIGIGLHACGIASDLVLDKCLKVNAKFVLCPCCYGSLHATDRLVYPRSTKFSSVSIEKYLCIGHAADQTEEDHPLAIRGARCMAIIDSDRGRLAEELGYKVTLSRLKPLTCTPKNNLLIGVPS